jgi:F-type H+-transporting ATPase subunit b
MAALFAAPVTCWATEDGMPYPGDLGQMIATLLIFLLLLAVLGKYAWKPIIEQLRKREDEYNTRVADAEARRKKADELAREYEDRLASIAQEGQEILERSRKTASQERDQLLAEARQEAKRAAEEAHVEIDNARRQARVELQAETARMAADIARRVLQDNLSEDDHRRLLQHATQQVAQQAETGGSR